MDLFKKGIMNCALPWCELNVENNLSFFSVMQYSIVEYMRS